MEILLLPKTVDTDGACGTAVGLSLIGDTPGLHVTVVFGEEVAIQHESVRQQRVRGREIVTQNAYALTQVFFGMDAVAGLLFQETEGNVRLA